MRLRGNLPVFWRQPGESQVGADSQSATILSGLSSSQQQFLELLPTAQNQRQLTSAARRSGLSPSQTAEFLDALRTEGVFLDDDRPPVTADELYWDALGYSPTQRAADLSRVIIGLGGNGQIVEQIAHHLARAGVRTLLVLPQSQETAQMRAQRMDFAQCLSRELPGVRTRAPLQSRPDLVVTVEDRVVDQVRARTLFQRAVPLLPVVVQDSHTELGPLIIPGSGPCLRCLDLWRFSVDPCWPAVLAQLPPGSTASTEALLERQVSALASRLVLSILQGQHNRWLGKSVTLNARDVLPEVYEWQVHPECGCAALPEEPPAGDLGKLTAEPILEAASK